MLLQGSYATHVQQCLLALRLSRGISKSRAGNAALAHTLCSLTHTHACLDVAAHSYCHVAALWSLLSSPTFSRAPENLKILLVKKLEEYFRISSILENLNHSLGRHVSSSPRTRKQLLDKIDLNTRHPNNQERLDNRKPKLLSLDCFAPLPFTFISDR